MSDVHADRPIMPDGYGVPDTTDGLLEWDAVEARLEAATEFWLATTRPDGRPHVVPRWGVWLDGRFWYDGSPMTRHARNLAGNPACALHLESGTEVVVLDGRSVPSAPVAGEFGQRLSDAFAWKYRDRGYAPSPDAWAGDDAGGLAVFTPRTGLAWTDFPTDVTRFHFPVA
ncbi:MAG: pyridoxamine 5'-phosphate oxidase family protein [Actinobacteria bacterium]|nr:pyridoxamine 5'-phosphate oxidase family protein [Actinomycetota bacterium]